MSYEELKKEVVALSFKEQKELSALLFSLWRKNNSEESSSLERRVQDPEPGVLETRIPQNYSCAIS